MNGSRTETRPPSGRPPRDLPRLPVADAVIVVMFLAALAALSGAMDAPSFVDRITVENPSAYDMDVAVTGADGDGVLHVGTARRGEASQFEHVIDQGEAWVFRFSAQGHGAGELRVPRQVLQRDQWRIEIPSQVIGALEATGAPPSS